MIKKLQDAITAIKNKYIKAGAILLALATFGIGFNLIAAALTTLNPLLGIVFVVGFMYALIVWMVGE